MRFRASESIRSRNHPPDRGGSQWLLEALLTLAHMPVHDGGSRRKVDFMSHDSGFRRNDHDNTPGAALRQKGRSKASKMMEDRLRQKRERAERLRRLMETRKADQ